MKIVLTPALTLTLSPGRGNSGRIFPDQQTPPGLFRFSIFRKAADHSPSPGGEGRGEDESKTPSLRFVFFAQPHPDLLPWEKEQVPGISGYTDAV
jgi:hypothetical protein